MYLIAKIGDSFLTEIGEYRLTLQWLILPDPNKASAAGSRSTYLVSERQFTRVLP